MAVNHAGQMLQAVDYFKNRRNVFSRDVSFKIYGIPVTQQIEVRYYNSSYIKMSDF